MDPTGRRVMQPEEMGLGMTKGMQGMPPQNMYMGEVRYGYRPSPPPLTPRATTTSWLRAR